MADLTLLDPRIQNNYNSYRNLYKGRRVAGICPTHGFYKGFGCGLCVKMNQSTCHINTYDWVEGWYDHLDPEPVYIHGKEHLFSECKKRGMIPKAFMKPKSQGKGWETARR